MGLERNPRVLAKTLIFTPKLQIVLVGMDFGHRGTGTSKQNLGSWGSWGEKNDTEMPWSGTDSVGREMELEKISKHFLANKTGYFGGIEP